MLCVSWKYTCVERDGEVRVWESTSHGSGKFVLTKPLVVGCLLPSSGWTGAHIALLQAGVCASRRLRGKPDSYRQYDKEAGGWLVSVQG